MTVIYSGPTIHFQPIEDFFIALVGWNGNTVDFNTPIEMVSFGQGFWGNGTPVLNEDGDGFVGQGEVHGVIRARRVLVDHLYAYDRELARADVRSPRAVG